jgi:serine/threonine protein kinase
VQVDIWSLGVLAYELLTTKLPYNGATMLETLQRIMVNKLEFPTNTSPLARDFMMRCLQTEAAHRSTVEELQQHPWITATYGST